MKNQEFLDRIVGDTLQLSPKMSSLEKDSIILVLNELPYKNHLNRIKNLIHENNTTYDRLSEIEGKDFDKKPIVLVVEGEDKSWNIGEIYLDIKFYKTLKDVLTKFHPKLYQYDGKLNEEIQLNDLISTLRIELTGDKYGINR